MSPVRVLDILVVDDEPILRLTLGDHLRSLGHRVREAADAGAAMEELARGGCDLVLLDHIMPGMKGLEFLGWLGEHHPGLSVVMMTAHASTDMVVEAFRRRVRDFLTKPVRLHELERLVEAVQAEAAAPLPASSAPGSRAKRATGVRKRDKADLLIGESSATRGVRGQLARAARLQVDNLLITGETGTGKEVAAREFHRLVCSPKAPFVAVNCPALTDTLLESALFGHQRGAFTGAAADRAGYFALADGGTLFLDEVADLSPGGQACLLRVLETRAFRPVGAARERSVNVHVVAATNRDLPAWIDDGRFRKDLYYRLNAFGVALAPLSQRREDILPLARHFLERFQERHGLSLAGFSPDAEAALLAYGYPGNVRELKHRVHQACGLRMEGEVRAEDFQFPDGLSVVAAAAAAAPSPAEDERARLVAALERNRWNRRSAARELGMPYSTLRYKLTRYGIR
jgi:DNA-binding NtrC family response regulator